METQTSEIAEGIYRFSTFVPDVGPTGLTFNQYLIDDEQPLLFHTGHRAAFPLLAEAIATITPLDRLRWITFGHLEADECGAMNQLLAAAPAGPGRPWRARMHGVAQRHGRPPTRYPCSTARHRTRRSTGFAISTRPMSPMAGRRASSTRRRPTRCCAETSSPSSATGRRSPRTTSSVCCPSRGRLRGQLPHAQHRSTLGDLRDLNPSTLAVMHGSCYAGDGSVALLALADDYDRRLADASS